MIRPLPSHGDRVAQPRSEVIPEGDGAPSTHTPPGATRHRTVTTGPECRGPLPFAAQQRRVPIGGIALIAVLCAVMAGMPSWIITGDPTIAVVMAGLLIGWSLAVAAPALVGCGNPVDRQLRRQGAIAVDLDDEHDSTETATTQLDAARLRARLVELEQRGYQR